ncbi:hypothetical protein H0O03_01130 [Candidatus Micrarchaeota archaeon]|nr:hypothetical protein [Candidatus Micrarchaeota archaeon]
MLLDAPTFELTLTPEVALGIVQKSVNSKGWKKYDVSDIKLVYTPFYVFTFDISAGEQNPSGKAALNAYSGELSDFVPVLMDRPLKKTRNTAEKFEAEVEASAISSQEAKASAQAKVAAQVGAQKDQVTISAVNKIYIPFFRVWVDVADDTYKIDVDASLGAPLGAEAVPARQKGWNEATTETLDKMKTPGGWMELGGKTIGEAGKAVSSKGDKGNPLANKGVQTIILIAIIAGLAYFAILGGPAGKTTCSPDALYAKKPGFFEAGGILPNSIGNDYYEIRGTCSFTNPSNEEEVKCARITLLADGQPTRAYAVVYTQNPIPANTNTPVVKNFVLNWTNVEGTNFDLKYDEC